MILAGKATKQETKFMECPIWGGGAGLGNIMLYIKSNMVLALVSHRAILLKQSPEERIQPRDYYFSDIEWDVDTIGGTEAIARLVGRTNYTTRDVRTDTWNKKSGFGRTDFEKEWKEDVVRYPAFGFALMVNLKNNPRYTKVISKMWQQDHLGFGYGQSSGCALRYVLKYLKPRFVEMLAPYLAKFSEASFVVGVHLRWGDYHLDGGTAKKPDSRMNRESARRLWNKTFSIASKESNVLYFLTTDNLRLSKETLQPFLPKNVLMTEGEPVHSGSRGQIRNESMNKVWMDFQLLAMTDVIVSNCRSSFSSCAAELGLVPMICSERKSSR